MAAKKTSSSSSPSPSKLCDSCKVTSSSIFCGADSAFLCYPCDSKIHAANSLAARHSRVLLCDVCEQAPAHVTCKADAANLCVTCDMDIHSANPLARRHVRVPISALSRHPSAVDLNVFGDMTAVDDEESLNHHHHQFHHPAVAVAGGVTGKIGGEDIDSYFDFEYGFVDEKSVVHVKDEDYQVMNLKSVGADDDSELMMDCVVPAVQVEQMKKLDDLIAAADGHRYGADFDFDFLGSKAFYTNNGSSLSHSVSSCSFDAGLVPDSIAMIDVSNSFGRQTNNVSECVAAVTATTTTTTQAIPSIGIDREARVLRYREKRKNRKFEKTIRYASRKAYAETRPRIKGRFVKRTDTCVDNENVFDSQHGFGDLGYGIVPSF